MFLNDGRLQSYLQRRISSCNLTDIELTEIYRMGYRAFKLQGRADAPASFLFDLTRYLLSEEAGVIVYKHICNSISFTHQMERLELL